MKRGSDTNEGMDFFDHLEILRRGVIAVFLVFAVCAATAFYLMDGIMPFFTASAGRSGLVLYAFAPLEKFTAYLKISALAGLAAAIPLALVLVAAFVAPALEKKQRIFLAAGIPLACAFVLAGAALAWFVLIPFAVGFFSNFASSDGILPMWSLESFVSLSAGLIAAMMLVCLIPPLLLGLIRAGIVKVRFLARGRRFVIVAIAIFAAVITPTVDVVSQGIVGVCMWALFEITLIAGRFLEPRRNTELRKQAGSGRHDESGNN